MQMRPPSSAGSKAQQGGCQTCPGQHCLLFHEAAAAAGPSTCCSLPAGCCKDKHLCGLLALWRWLVQQVSLNVPLVHQHSFLLVAAGCFSRCSNPAAELGPWRPSHALLCRRGGASGGQQGMRAGPGVPFAQAPLHVRPCCSRQQPAYESKTLPDTALTHHRQAATSSSSLLWLPGA